MFRKRTLLATVAAVALALLTPVAPGNAAEPGSDWVRVDRVLVNKLGGVSVSGEFSCAATYGQLLAGTLQGVRETEFGDEWYTIPAPESTDTVALLTNADNYTVKQPSGKRLMIVVEHGSSRLTPCLITQRTMPDGNVIPESKCPVLGGPCRWETDRYAYDRAAYGPLFDYSSNGKFKAAELNVAVYDYGIAVMIFDEYGNWKADHFSPYAADVYFNDIIRAVSYR